MTRARWWAMCVFLGLFAGALGGCARTTLNATTAPSVRGRVFLHVLVIGNFADQGLRQQIESRIVGSSRVKVTRFDAFSALSVDNSPAAVTAVVSAGNFDAVLLLSPGDGGAVTEPLTPDRAVSSCARSDPWTGQCTQWTTQAVAGTTVTKPWQDYTIRLYASGVEVWRATATTGGNALATGTTLVRSVADKTVARLLAESLIK